MADVDFRAGARAITNDVPLPTAEIEFHWPGVRERALKSGDQKYGSHSLGAQSFALPSGRAETGRNQLPLATGMAVNVYPRHDMQTLMRGVEPYVHKIAVLRSNGIGDFIFALPALQALRLAYPNAEIVLLGLDWHAEFLRDRPGPVDRVEVVPRSRGVREPADFNEDPAEVEAFFERMLAEHFDLAFQMHGGGRFSNPFVQRLGARLTLGFRSPDAQALDRWVPYAFYQLEILRYLEVAALAGATLTSLEPRVTVTEQDLAEAIRALPPSGMPLAVLNPGAGDPRRRWPIEKFAAVGNALAWAGAQVVVIGASGDQPLAEGIASAMAAPTYNLCGQLSLSGLAGLLSRAAVVVSNDSGPLHLAAAVGSATVGIYWCGNLITAGPITRTRHRPAISWRLDCPVCGLNCTRNSCEHSASFVAEVSQEEVTASALELMAQAAQLYTQQLQLSGNRE